MEVTALEIIAIAARTGTYRDPRDPRGTRAGITFADVCMGLARAGDRWGADMALMIGTHDVRKADEAKRVLAEYVREECARDGITPDADKVANAVERAISDAVYSPKGDRGGSKYYRWAMSELMSRAESAADSGMRQLFKRAA